MTSTKMM